MSWRAARTTNDTFFILGDDGKILCEAFSSYAARLIVTAVNSHAELLAAAKGALVADDFDHEVWARLKASIAHAEEPTP